MQADITPNILVNADCIDLFRRIGDEAVDLVYLDPPLVPPGTMAEGWSEGSHEDAEQLRLIAKACQHAHQALKRTGSLLFHTTSSLTFDVRLILNQIFGNQQFRGEIVWAYRKPQKFRRTFEVHDTIVRYSKSDQFTDNPVFRQLTSQEVRRQYTQSDGRGPFALIELTVPFPRPSLQFEWKGLRPPGDRSWRFSAEALDKLESDGRIDTAKDKGLPHLKSYLTESEGVDVGTIWTDVPLLSPASAENTRYPTQKPLGVIERLLLKSSAPNDIILDPFCGSGTTLLAAGRHQRQWIGCDNSKAAFDLTKRRLSHERGAVQSAGFMIADSATLQQIPQKPFQQFKPVAVRLEDFGSVIQVDFVLNRPVILEENRHFEFKEIRGGNAVSSIVNTSDEYAVAFLNSDGGSIFWGIRDLDRVVVGVSLSYVERDKVRRDVTSKLNQIEPRIDPSRYRIELRGILDEFGFCVPDMYVVELVVPPPTSHGPYYTGGSDVWVKVDGGKQKLRGTALTEFIKNRLAR